MTSTGRAYETALSYVGGRWTAEIRWNGVAYAKWQATAGGLVSPNLASGWAPVAPSAGVPSLAAIDPVPATTATGTALAVDSTGQIWAARAGDPASSSWVAQPSGRADWYDDFSLYPDGTVLTAGFMPQINSGSGYLIPPATSGTPTIIGGKLYDTMTGTTTWYRGVQLSRPVESFVGEVMWEDIDGSGGFSQTPTILIMPEYQWLDRLIHIRVTLSQLTVEFSTRAGVTGFAHSYSTSDGTLANGLTSLAPGKRHAIVVRISGNTMKISVGGIHNEIVDRRIGQLNGRFVFIEQIGASNTRVRWLRVGANCPALLNETAATQPRAAALDDVSRYSLSVPLSLRNAAGRGLGNTGAFNYVAPRISPASTNASAADQALADHVLIFGDLATPGMRLVFKASGTFAANANAKRLKVACVTNFLDTGSITINGGMWEAELRITCITSSSFRAVARIVTVDATGTSKTYLGNWLHTGVNYNMGFSTPASGVAAADVTILEDTVDLVPVASSPYI